MDAFNDSLSTARPEHFSVADIDSDGKHEIIMASNGGTNPVYGTQDGSTPYSDITNSSTYGSYAIIFNPKT